MGERMCTSRGSRGAAGAGLERSSLLSLAPVCGCGGEQRDDVLVLQLRLAGSRDAGMQGHTDIASGGEGHGGVRH